MLCHAILVAGAVSSLWAGPPDFERRVQAQIAIEEVYWKHRIWPADNPDPKPSLAAVLPESTLRARVDDYLMKSRALEQLWARPIRTADLQAEIDRMAVSSRAPEVLQELFAALDDDPVLIAECLARPLIADRLIREAYASDPRYHSELKAAIERSIGQGAPIGEARRLGGEYAEADWLLGVNRPMRGGRLDGVREVRLDADSWRQSVARLAAEFVRPTRAVSRPADPNPDDLPIGTLGRLQEDDETFFVRGLLERGKGRLRVATVAWRKKPFDEWWAQERGTFGVDPPVGSVSETALVSLPELRASTCTPDTWRPVPVSPAVPIREAHTAVWTGSEMIVWGGYNGNVDTNTGGRYDPATDLWSTTSTTNAPDARDTHTAVWTGSKMVIWGGGNEIYVPKATGGLYDPTTNSWTLNGTATSGAPTAREYHTATWTGSRMVVWGGWDGSKDIDTGGRYDPVANSWATIAKAGAPSARDGHTAVWSGSRVIIWGGEDDNAVGTSTGSRYDPVGNAWLATSATTAEARWFHTAVWTGSTMIVWGGSSNTVDLTSGGIYNPSTDSWTLTSATGAPTARDMHVAVWTDSLSEMDVWGGQDDNVVQLNSGGRYNPATNTWSTMSSLGAPVGRRFHTGVWTGSELITWGGWNVTDLNDGGRYCSGVCATSPPAGSASISVSGQVGAEVIAWSAPPGAAAYDLVRGSLGLLQSTGGDYTASTQACLAKDRVAASITDGVEPQVGDGFWYVVRGLCCSGYGTYNEGDGSQTGSRDAEINASLGSCQ